MRPSEIVALLNERGFVFRKSLGQNFLLDPNLLQAVANAGDVGPQDLVIEVGTGAGTFTRVLAERAAQVVTFELDPRLQEIAREVVGDRPNVAYVQGDVLKGETGLHPEVEAAARRAGREGLRAKCVSNFPYSIATPLFVHLLERSVVEQAFELAIIAGTVQREVADRLTATAISKDYGVPSLLTQTLARVRIDRKVSPGAFLPPPKVESAVIRIEPRTAAEVEVKNYAQFRDLVRAVFQFRRKTLRNAIERGLGVPVAVVDDALRQMGIDANARVEAVSVNDLAALASRLRTTP